MTKKRREILKLGSVASTTIGLSNVTPIVAAKEKNNQVQLVQMGLVYKGLPEDLKVGYSCNITPYYMRNDKSEIIFQKYTSEDLKKKFKEESLIIKFNREFTKPPFNRISESTTCIPTDLNEILDLTQEVCLAESINTPKINVVSKANGRVQLDSRSHGGQKYSKKLDKNERSSMRLGEIDIKVIRKGDLKPRTKDERFGHVNQSRELYTEEHTLSPEIRVENLGKVELYEES